MDDQILLSSYRKKDAMGLHISQFFADCYYKNGKILDRRSRKYSIKIAIIIWFFSFLSVLSLSILRYIDINIPFLILFPIIIGVSVGAIPLTLPHKSFSGIYVSLSPDTKTTILIKPKRDDGTRRFDDDVIYHLIIHLRRFDPSLSVIE